MLLARPRRMIDVKWRNDSTEFATKFQREVSVSSGDTQCKIGDASM